MYMYIYVYVYSSLNRSRVLESSCVSPSVVRVSVLYYYDLLVSNLFSRRKGGFKALAV
jgi:hypothetical protein